MSLISEIVAEVLSKTIEQRQDEIAPKAIRDATQITCQHDWDRVVLMCRCCGVTMEDLYFRRWERQ